jgi:glutamate formiminotransferase
MIIECVPNVSEGRDRGVLDGIAAVVRATPGATLADMHADADHHRAVFTVLGAPAAIELAALALVAAALAAVDMRRHAGRHPRLGAVDVLPFVPLAGATLTVAVNLAHRVGERLAELHGVPVYFYEAAARRPERRQLPDVRRGGHEGLAARLATELGRPDAGPARLDARAGAIIVGAREVLVAFNVWLDTEDVTVAREVARAVRERDGGLPRVRAIGVTLTSQRVAQVALNLLDHRLTPLPVVWDRVVDEARRRGVGVRRGELVGLIPRAAFAGRAPESVGLAGFTEDRLLDVHVQRLLDRAQP